MESCSRLRQYCTLTPQKSYRSSARRPSKGIRVRAQQYTRQRNRDERYPQQSKWQREREWEDLKTENEGYYSNYETWLDRYPEPEPEPDRRKKAIEAQKRLKYLQRGRNRRRRPREDPPQDRESYDPFDEQGRWQQRDTQQYRESDKRLSRYQNRYEQPESSGFGKNFRTSRERSYDDSPNYGRNFRTSKARTYEKSRPPPKKKEETEIDYDDPNYFDRNELRYVNSPADIAHQKRLAKEMSEKRAKKEAELKMSDELSPEDRKKRFHTLIVSRVSITEVQQLTQLYINDLDTTSLCIILVQLSRIIQKMPIDRVLKAAQKFFQWQLLPLCNEEELKRMPPPLLASSIWAMARAQMFQASDGRKGFKQMLSVAKSHEDYSAENLALMMWAVGESGYGSKDCAVRFIELGLKKLKFFEIDALASTILAMAKARYYQQDQLKKFLGEIEKRIEECTDREIATVMKALEEQRYYDQNILDKLSQRIKQLHEGEEPPEFKPRSAAVILQAWAQIGYLDEEAYKLLMKDLEPSSNAWALTTTIHALAVMNRPSSEVQSILDLIINVISMTGTIKKYWLKFIYTAIIVHEGYGGVLDVPPKLREAGREVRQQMVRQECKLKNPTTNKVHGVLRRIHLIGQRNVIIGKGDARVELQVKGFQGHTKVALQFCSNNSYLVNDRSVELGRSRAYRKLLEYHGFKVVIIRNSNFMKIQEKQRRWFLKNAFKELNLEVEGQKYMDELELKRQKASQKKQAKELVQKEGKSEKDGDDKKEAQVTTVESPQNVGDDKTDSQKQSQEEKAVVEGVSQVESAQVEAADDESDEDSKDIDSEGVLEEGKEGDEVVALEGLSSTATEGLASTATPSHEVGSLSKDEIDSSINASNDGRVMDDKSEMTTIEEQDEVGAISNGVPSQNELDKSGNDDHKIEVEQQEAVSTLANGVSLSEPSETVAGERLSDSDQNQQQSDADKTVYDNGNINILNGSSEQDESQEIKEKANKDIVAI